MRYPPHALRVLHLPDRLVLHDLSDSLKPANPVNRNALIAAANRAQTLHNSTPTLLDLPTPPSNIRPAYLTIPFHDNENPYVHRTAEEAAIPHNPPVEVAVGVLGIVHVPAGRFCILVDSVKEGGRLPSGMVYAVNKVRCIGLNASGNGGEVLQGVVKMLESGSVYYMVTDDLTQGRGGFWWTHHMVERLGEGRLWGVRSIYGFVGSRQMRCVGGEFWMTLVSSRSRRRAGTRYITRGVDARGDVANFVETQQIVWSGKGEAVGFNIIRGSIPVFWRQINGIAKPAPELDSGLRESRVAFRRHFAELEKAYGKVCAVSLVDKSGSEGVLANAFDKFMELERPRGAKLVAFDFHKWCAGKEYEKGLSRLMTILENDIKSYEVGAQQNGVFRVNCVDCLDRTNVVQSMIARAALITQLQRILGVGIGPHEGGRLYTESEDAFKHIWGDNADAVSKQYSGTGALKTDFTRTGKRSTTGVIGDGVKSVMRMYYKNFIDEGRQEIIDIISGNASIRQPRRGSEKSEALGGLWYTFDASRINAGGDKQDVVIELYDSSMYVMTADGIAFEYPRRTLSSWNKIDDGKAPDRKLGVAKLRMWFNQTENFPGTNSPLDLQFKSGRTARENFLRAVVSWARSETVTLLQRQCDLRVSVFAASNPGEHMMEDWGLSGRPENQNHVVALIVPEANAGSRSLGLTAVPLDVDQYDFELVSACSVADQGPAIAIIASKSAARTIMNVRESISGRAAAFSAGGAAGVSLEVCGTSLCFVSAKLSGAMDIFHTISAMKLGRSNFDVTTQFNHFVMCGNLGNVQWHKEGEPTPGRSGRQWVEIGDGSACYSLSDGMSVMRNSFTTLRYDDELSPESFWKEKPTHIGKSSIFMRLADGIVDGRLGPVLPTRISQLSIVLSEVRGEAMKMSPDMDQNAALNLQLMLFCEYCAIDYVSSRSTTRASSNPRWNEVLRIPMVPLDEEEVMNSFIVGQVVVPTAIGDQQTSAHFVIPISSAYSDDKSFTATCRLAGFKMGRLTGKITIETEDWGSLADKLGQIGHPNSNTNPSTPKANGVSVQRKATRRELPVPGQAKMNEWVSRGSVPGVRSTAPRKSSAKATAKASIKEVNVQLDAARKRGSKQIKSVVTKLSGFLNQQGGNAPGSSGSTSGVGVRKFRGDYSHGNESNDQVEDTFREVFEDSFQPESAERFGGFQPASEAIDSREKGTNNYNVLTDSTRRKGHDEGQRAQKPNLLDDFVSFEDRKNTTSSLHEPGSQTRKYRPLRPESIPRQSRTSVPKHVMASKEDLLIQNLQGSRNEANEDVLLQGLEREMQKQQLPDPLLRGLSAEKNGGAQDDDWSDFKSAAR